MAEFSSSKHDAKKFYIIFKLVTDEKHFLHVLHVKFGECVISCSAT